MDCMTQTNKNLSVKEMAVLRAIPYMAAASIGC
jgi:hypothetical protein